MKCYITFFCLQAEVNTSNITTDFIIAHAWYNENSVGILKSLHVLCFVGWFSYLLVNSCLIVICLFACSWPLGVAGYYYYHCLHNNH